MVSHESTGVEVKVAPVIDPEVLESMAKQVEQQIADAVTAGLAAAIDTLKSAFGVVGVVGPIGAHASGGPVTRDVADPAFLNAGCCSGAVSVDGLG